MKQHQKRTHDRKRRESVSIALQGETVRLLKREAQGERRSLSYLLADWIEGAIGGKARKR